MVNADSLINTGFFFFVILEEMKMQKNDSGQNS